MSEDKPLDLEQERFIAKIRRLMIIATATTFIAIAVIMVMIGYRVSRGGGSTRREPDVTAFLPKGARVISTAVAGDKVVVTLDTGASIEIRTFDVRDLHPTGRLRFVSEP